MEERRKDMGMKRLIVTAAFLSIVAMPALAQSAEKGQGGMQGGAMEGHGTMMQGQGMQGQGMQGGHDMMKMGSQVYSGKMGPWNGEARMIDMKAQMAASGVHAQGTMTNTHHIAFALTDPKTKARVTEGTGTVTVTGPDKSVTKYNISGMQGHFGADINLPKPGKYTCNVKLESGGKTGTATFHYTAR
jgi:hypothetical protein